VNHDPLDRDWVSLRRHLIDEGLMAREDGWYWRTAGFVHGVHEGEGR
jgi:hypothetical protein